jgi:hypothetical protein
VGQTRLHVATKLGDLLDDLVAVGRLVPSLLIPDESLKTIGQIKQFSETLTCFFIEFIGRGGVI